jgi:hypothetical protein
VRHKSGRIKILVSDSMIRVKQYRTDRCQWFLCVDYRQLSEWILPPLVIRAFRGTVGPNQIPQLKSLVERTGARFLHHDGGIEHSSSLLPGLISRADVLLFPIDCISHDAVATLKRLCRQLEKPYLPLRTASLATLASSLAGMARNRDA